MKMLKIILILMLTFITGISSAQTGITINADAKLSISGDAIIKITDCDFTNNSSENQFVGTFVFTGTSNQQIGGTSESEFSILEIDNTNGLTLANNVTVNDELILNQGVIDIQDYDLTLAENSDISGSFSSGNMISADGSGNFIREISTTGTYFFPVGDLTSGADYSPVELDFISGTFTNASVSVNLSNNKHPDNPSTTDYLNRYWILSSSGISDFSCDMTFEYVSDDIVGNEANIRGAIRKTDGWKNLGQASSNQFSGTHWALGEISGINSEYVNIKNVINNNPEVFYYNGTIFINNLNDIKIKNIEIYNAIGQLVSIESVKNEGHDEIPFSNTKGYYLLKINTNKSYFVKQILVN